MYEDFEVMERKRYTRTPMKVIRVQLRNKENDVKASTGDRQIKIANNCKSEQKNVNTYDEKHKKQNEKNVSEKEKTERKIVIRLLPPTLTEEDFFNSYSEDLKSELVCYYFVNGNVSKYSSKEITHSRMYLTFKNATKAEEFIRTQHGKLYYDSCGVKYRSIVCLAPYQSFIYSNKPDRRNNTLDEDAYFQQCCEEMKNPPVHQKTDIDYFELINVEEEDGAILPPVVLELRKQLNKNVTSSTRNSKN